MNKDFRVSVTLPTHHKTTKLMRRLGDRSFYCLIRLWAYVAANKPNGDLSGMDAEDIEIAADWQGGEGKFVETLIDIRFLEFKDGVFCLHDWEDHNMYAAKSRERSQNASAAAAVKWKNRTNKLTRSQRLSAAREKGTHAPEDWEEMVEFFGGKCVKCGADGEVVKDHVIPIYQGGSDGIDNLQPLCRSCSCSKGPDNTDYRVDFCEKSACEMPAKWLQNACETPADACDDASPTPSPSPSPSQKNKEHNPIGLCLSPPSGGDAPPPPCPHQKIVKIYNSICAPHGLPLIQEWDPTAQGWLKTRWREKPERQSVSWWTTFFNERIITSDFLTGKVNGWVADLRWIVRSQNFAKIMNGNYVNREKQTRLDPKLMQRIRWCYENEPQDFERYCKTNGVDQETAKRWIERNSSTKSKSCSATSG